MIYSSQPGSYDLTVDKVAAIVGIDATQFRSKTQAEQQDMTLLAEAHKFMTYLRNRGAHRLGGLMDVDSFYRQQGGQEYTAEGTD